MSILGNAINNIFSPPPVAPVVAAPVVANPGNIPDGGVVSTTTPGAAPNGVLPDPTTMVADPVDDSPLAAFKDLWDDAPIDKNASPADTGPTPLKQEDVAAAVNKIDFSKSVTPEVMAAITEGGEGALAALVGVINAVGRDSLTQATLVSNQLANKAIDAALLKQAASLPNLVRDASASAHLTDTNPIFNDPAIKPVIDAAQERLQIKYPQATPEQLTRMTNDYIVAMGAAFAPKPTGPQLPAGEQDWSDFG
jgi:hypothetical protein